MPLIVLSAMLIESCGYQVASSDISRDTSLPGLPQVTKTIIGKNTNFYHLLANPKLTIGRELELKSSLVSSDFLTVPKIKDQACVQQPSQFTIDQTTRRATTRSFVEERRLNSIDPEFDGFNVPEFLSVFRIIAKEAGNQQQGLTRDPLTINLHLSLLKELKSHSLDVFKLAKDESTFSEECGSETPFVFSQTLGAFLGASFVVKFKSEEYKLNYFKSDIQKLDHAVLFGLSSPDKLDAFFAENADSVSVSIVSSEQKNSRFAKIAKNLNCDVSKVSDCVKMAQNFIEEFNKLDLNDNANLTIINILPSKKSNIIP